MATTRLRKTFHYPDDEDSHGSHDEMDEEEQETLLTTLSTSTTTNDRQYILIFSSLPLIIILAFLRVLALSPSKSTTLASLLSITSLLATAYIMYLVPVSAPLFPYGLGGFKGQAQSQGHGAFPVTIPSGSGSESSQSRRPKRQLFTIPSLTPAGAHAATAPGLDTPLALVLPYFNVLICLLVALVAWRERGYSAAGSSSAGTPRTALPDGLWMVFLLPGGVFAVVLVVRKSIAEVHDGLGELNALRYRYKGA